MNADKLTIRPVQEHEAITLQEIAVETFSDTYASANTPENMKQYISENFGLLRIREELKDLHSITLFAILDKKPVGYLKLNLEKGILDNVESNSLEIARIYVKKDFKGKKIGKALFDAAVEIARQYKHEHIWLGVWEKNTHAIEFYQKMGFYAAGNHLFKLGEDLQRDIIMRFDLK